MGKSDPESDGEGKHVSPEETKLHKKWDKELKKGTIPAGQLPPWKGGPPWVPPPKAAKEGKDKHKEGKDKEGKDKHKDDKHKEGKDKSKEGKDKDKDKHGKAEDKKKH
jgi:uncharacterized membrane protein YukC